MGAYLLWLVILVLADQGMKWWTVVHLQLGQTKTIIPQVLALTNVHNDGAAWSSFAGMQGPLITVGIIVLVIGTYYLIKHVKTKPVHCVAVVLIMAGAIGNLIDRVMQGYVVDMFMTKFINFPIFNVADICLTVGTILLIILILRED